MKCFLLLTPAVLTTLNRLPGPPLSQDSTVVHLVSRGVIVGLGVMGVGGDPGISSWATRNTRFDISWVSTMTTLSNLRSYIHMTVPGRDRCRWKDIQG